VEKPTYYQQKALEYFQVPHKDNISSVKAYELLNKVFYKVGEKGKEKFHHHLRITEPATDYDKSFLAYFNVRFHPDITHLDAVDIQDKINSDPDNKKRWRGRGPATTKQKEILIFFNIDFTTGPFYNNKFLSEYEARQLRDKLLSDSQNKKLWNKHVKVLKEKAKLAVTDEQTTVLKFFKKPIPETMTTHEAEELIGSLLIISKNQQRWDNYQEKSEQKELEKQKKFEEKQAFDSLYEEVNDPPEEYYCKKINKKRFKNILDQLLNAGLTHEQLEDDVDIFYDKAFEVYPELERVYK